MIYIVRLAWLLSCWGLYGGILYAQSQAPVILSRLSGPIQLDGRSDEAAWEGVRPLPLTMYSPNFEGVPTEKTEILIGYDDEYLYAAGRFYDSDHEKIMGTTLDRDGNIRNDDIFALILDTFNDNETALAFLTTPTGVRVDLSIANDAESERGFPGNRSWNTFWDVASYRNEEGWFAEMRIPFSSLRFQSNDGTVTMGLIAYRYTTRKNERLIYPWIPPKWQRGFLKPSVAQDVILEGIKTQNPIYITPYLMGGMDQQLQDTEADTLYDLITQPSRAMGLDVKYSLTSNLTLDITLNTDFAQAEADDEQINLTRFSLFFPEKRLFFQERASLFNFNTGGPNRLFYSRRIGLSPDGPVPIYGGLRLVGRFGDWDLGLLSMQTVTEKFPEADTTILSENFSVFRLRRPVLNQYSYMGGMLTSRVNVEGSFNYGLGVDGTIRVYGDDYFVFSLTQTIDREQGTDVSPLDASRARFNWENRANQGLGYELSYSRSGPDYEPRMGFEARENYYLFRGKVSYAWLPGEDSRTYRQSLEMNSSLFYRNIDNKLESSSMETVWNFAGKIGDAARIWASRQYEDLSDTLELSEEAYIPPGQYLFHEVGGFYRMPSGKLFRSSFNFKAGSFYDGWKISTRVEPEWILSNHFSFRARYQFNAVWFNQRQPTARFIAHILSARPKIMFNYLLSVSGLLQYNGAIDALVVNFRLRYNPREGTDVYLVYNEEIDTEGIGPESVSTMTNRRTILLKYSTTFLTFSR